MRSRTPSVRVLAIGIALLAAACGGDSSTEPDGVRISDLVGSWTASSVLFTNKSNPAQEFDIIAGGGELRVTVLAGGRARTWLDLGPFSDEWDAQLSLNGNQLTSTPAEATRPTRRYTIEMVGGELRMTSTDAMFDFSLAGGSEVPANEVVVLVRQ